MTLGYRTIKYRLGSEFSNNLRLEDMRKLLSCLNYLKKTGSKYFACNLCEGGLVKGEVSDDSKQIVYIEFNNPVSHFSFKEYCSLGGLMKFIHEYYVYYNNQMNEFNEFIYGMKPITTQEGRNNKYGERT